MEHETMGPFPRSEQQCYMVLRVTMRWQAVVDRICIFQYSPNHNSNGVTSAFFSVADADPSLRAGRGPCPDLNLMRVI